jgi:hypothetical protein
MLEPIDPLINENKTILNTNNEFFNADEEMLYILMNKDINEYLNFVNNKYSKIEKLKIKKEEEDKNIEIKNLKNELLYVQTQLNNINTKLEYDERRNKFKNQMIQNINEGFDKLEKTLKNFKNI